MPRATAEPPIVYSNIRAQPINQATLQIENAGINKQRALQVLSKTIFSPKMEPKYKQRTIQTQMLLYKSIIISKTARNVPKVGSSWNQIMTNQIPQQHVARTKVSDSSCSQVHMVSARVMRYLCFAFL
jgi:hypothetical protein